MISATGHMLSYCLIDNDSLAALSAFSFPGIPLCPGIHINLMSMSDVV